jgi:hypothetical protein
LRGRRLTVALAVLAGPVQAECTGGGCYDGIAILLGAVLAYGLVAIVLIVLLVRAKWRRAGWWVLGLVLAITVGVPLLSQGWLAWKLAAMERREVVGQPPGLIGRGVLLIPQGEACYNDLCMSVLYGRGAEGAYVLPQAALEGLDLTQPIPLADLPLQLWRAPGTAGAEVLRRSLSAAERQEVVASLSYLIVTAEPYYWSVAGPVEAGLQTHPDLGGMRPVELVRLAMAPLEGGSLSLADLRFDLLDLWLADSALAIPLIPTNRQGPDNNTVGQEAAAKVLCEYFDGVPDPGCLTALE